MDGCSGSPTSDEPRASRDLARLKDELDRLLTVSIDEAERIASLIETKAAASSSLLDQALARRARAQLFHVRGDYGSAAVGYRSAIDLYESLDRPELAAGVRKTLLDPLMYLGCIDEALSEADKARAVLHQVGDARALAELDINHGNVLLRAGRPDEARRAYEEAVEALAGDEDDPLLGTAVLNLANALVQTFDFEAAAARFARAAQIYEKAGRTIHVAEARYGELYLDLARGAFGRVLRHAGDVEAGYAACDHQRGLALAKQARARALLELGFPQAAREQVEEARRLLAPLAVSSELGRGELILACAMSRLGRPRAAAGALRIAAEHFSRDGNRVLEAGVGIRRSEWLMEDGDPAAAREAALDAMRKLEAFAVRREASSAALLLARIARDEGRLTESASWLEEAERVLGGLSDPWYRLEAATLRAGLHEATGDDAAADADYRAAARELDLLVEAAGTGDMRMGLRRDHAGIYRRLARLGLQRDRVAEALAWADRANSRELLESLRVRRPDERASAADRLRADLQALYRAQADQDASNERRDEDRLSKLIRDREHELHRALEEAAEEASPSTGASGVARLSRCLRPHEALAQFARCADDLWVFVLRGGGEPVVHHLGSVARAERLVQRARFLLLRRAGAPGDDRDLAETGRCLADLGETLMQAVFSELTEDVERLFLVPEARLHLCPFEALTVAGRPVLERVEVVRAPSAALVAHARSSARREEVGSILVLGVDDARAPSMMSEARSVCGIWRGRRVHLLDAGGRVEDWPRDGRCSVLHVAAHSVARPDRPELGGLLLDGSTINLLALQRVRLDCDLVVLAGCETGGVDARFGNELVGLVGGFFQAGARAVLSSLWPVDDEATHRFMITLHRRLAEGQGAAAAARAAALATREEAPDPYLWAPWTLHGDADARVVRGSDPENLYQSG